jgi:hypothetical protein
MERYKPPSTTSICFLTNGNFFLDPHANKICASDFSSTREVKYYCQ